MIVGVVTLLRTQLFRSTLIYTAAGVLHGVGVFMLVPVLTRALDRESYGLVAIFRVLASFSLPFIAFYASISRQYYDREKVNFAEYVLNAVLIIAVNAVFVALALLVFGGLISGMTAFPRGWLWCAVVYALGKALMETVLVMWRVRMKPILFGIFQVSQTALMFGSVVLLVVGFDWGWQGGVLAETAAMALYGLVALPILRAGGWLAGSINRDYMREILAYNLPLIFHLLCRSTITMSDRIFIASLASVADTGLYAAGYQIGMIIFLLSTSFNAAWVPFLYSKLKENDHKTKRWIVRFTYAYFAAVLALSIGLGWIAPWLAGFFLGPVFADSAQYVVWIALGFAFNAMYWMVSNYIFYQRKTRLIAFITGFAALLNIVLNYVLIRAYGPIGAAQATAITFFVVFVVTWWVSARVHAMPWFGGQLSANTTPES